MNNLTFQKTVLCLAVAICFATLPAQNVRAEDPKPISVMSFNIRFGTANDGDNHWKYRKELVVKTIKDFSPDLLGTQETLKFQADYLQENLPDYSSIGWSRESDPEQGEQCTIYYKTSRFEKVAAGQFWLSETPEKVASKSWDTSLPRIATWIKLKDKSNGGKEFLFLNTHFDHRGKVARRESAKLIAKKFGEFKLPGIITGDFNCAEKSEPYNSIVGLDSVKLFDTYRDIHKKASKSDGTFGGFRGNEGGARIDWVLRSSAFETKSAAIDRSNDNKRYPSDHYPVTAVLQFK